METMIELFLFAAAAYGIKSYLFTPEAVQDREIFPTRGATLAKRLVNGQNGRHHQINTNTATAFQKKPVLDETLTPKPEAVASNRDGTPEAVVPEANEQLAISQTIQTQQSDTRRTLVPEDSTLKRHYLTQVAEEQNLIKNPYPTDSVLRRHYQQNQTAALNLTPPTTKSEFAEEPMENTDTPKNHQPQAKRISVPEDSVLKRHYLSRLRTEIEKQYPPCPSDAVLKRHYLQLIESRLEAYLVEIR